MVLYICVFLHLFVQVLSLSIHIYIYIYMYVCMYIQIDIYIHTICNLYSCAVEVYHHSQSQGFAVHIYVLDDVDTHEKK